MKFPRKIPTIIRPVLIKLQTGSQLENKDN